MNQMGMSSGGFGGLSRYSRGMQAQQQPAQPTFSNALGSKDMWSRFNAFRQQRKMARQRPNMGSMVNNPMITHQPGMGRVPPQPMGNPLQANPTITHQPEQGRVPNQSIAPMFPNVQPQGNNTSVLPPMGLPDLPGMYKGSAQPSAQPNYSNPYVTNR